MVFLLVAGTGVLGFLLTLSAFLTFLFPGITVWEIMNEGKVGPLKNFVELVLILLAQYVIIRYMHSIFSRRLILRINRSISAYILADVLPILGNAAPGQGREGQPGNTCEDYRETATLLIEARMYKIQSDSIFGYFPIFFIQPDLTTILDKETLETLRGHMELPT